MTKTGARPLYGDYGTDLDIRAGVGYVWGRYYILFSSLLRT